jgi:hypothetical protein
MHQGSTHIAKMELAVKTSNTICLVGNTCHMIHSQRVPAPDSLAAVSLIAEALSSVVHLAGTSLQMRSLTSELN